MSNVEVAAAKDSQMKRREELQLHNRGAVPSSEAGGIGIREDSHSDVEENHPKITAKKMPRNKVDVQVCFA